MRKEFEMTQAQYDAILEASKAVPYIVVGGVAPTSPRENAHRAWQALGKELGFDWESARPSERGPRFFTAVVHNPNLITPCPVCGMEDDCPHTPARCRHDWEEVVNIGGNTRTCRHCGRVEKQTVVWDTVKP